MPSQDESNAVCSTSLSYSLQTLPFWPTLRPRGGKGGWGRDENKTSRLKLFHTIGFIGVFYELSINLHFTYSFDHNGSSTGSCKRKPEVDPSQS